MAFQNQIEESSMTLRDDGMEHTSVYYEGNFL